MDKSNALLFIQNGNGMWRRSSRHARPNSSIQQCRFAVDVTHGPAMMERFAFVFAISVQNDSCMSIS